MKKYRPSNGTEGLCFMEIFCQRCIHEEYVNTGDPNSKCCGILNRTFLYDVDHPLYPKEWIEKPDGSCECTAFKPKAKATPSGGRRGDERKQG